MANLPAIKPDRIRAANRNLKHRVRLVRARRVDGTTEDAAGGGLAGGAEGGLGDGVPAWVELEDYGVADCGGEGVGGEGELGVVAEGYGVGCREGKGEEREEEG